MGTSLADLTSAPAVRIAVLSDIHGNLAALEAVVADFTRRGADAVVNLGDNLSGPLLPLETAEYLMAQRWTHLAGNHDRQLVAAGPEGLGPSDAFARSRLSPAVLAWTAGLATSLALNDEVFLCHGTPGSDTGYFLETAVPGRTRPATPLEVHERLGGVAAAVVLCGHTHIPRSVRSTAGQLLLNPGSVGLPAYEDDRPFQHVVETGSPDARYALIEKRNGGWSAQMISLPYDFRPMAALAARNGRRDWECALSTGYMPPLSP